MILTIRTGILAGVEAPDTPRPRADPPAADKREHNRRRALEARREIWRSAALEAGELHFGRNGFRETSMHDIAAAAGISLSALYEVFGSKEALFVAVVDAAFLRLFPLLQGDARHGGAAPAPLDFLDHLFSSIEQNRDAFSLYARGRDEIPARLREGENPFAAYEEQMATRLTAVLTGAPLPPDLPARAVAEAIIACVVALSRSHLRADPEASLTAVARQVKAIFTPLVAPSGPDHGDLR